MSGYARYRDQNLRRAVTGTYYRRIASPQTVTETRTSGSWKQCWDVIGHKDLREIYYLPNPLTIVEYSRHLPVINGRLILFPPTVERNLEGWPMEFEAVPVDPSLYFSLTDLVKSNLAWQAIAGTAPNRPHVSVPTFIAELKDIPELIRGWGGSILAQLAKGHLTWRWGIAPLISDVRKMFTFLDSVDNRVKDLQSLQAGKYLKKRTVLGNASLYLPPSGVVINSNACFVKAFASTTMSCKTWSTVQWSLGTGVGLPRRVKTDPYWGHAKKLRELAWRLDTGYTNWEAIATAWELIPWSWFVDWFTGFGSLIAAANNTVPMNWGNICLMRTLSSKTEYEVDKAASDKWISISGKLTTSCTRKERHVGVGPSGPPTNLLAPFIEGKTWSILGSLWVLNSSNAKSIRRAKVFVNPF